MVSKARLRSTVRLARLRAAKLARIGRRPRLWRGVGLGVVAAVEHLHVPFDPATRTVLDVGASRGQFALFALERFPHARLVCFEPLPQARDRLAEVLGHRAEIHEVAIGLHPGFAEFHVSAADDSSSMLPIGLRQVREYPGTEQVRTTQVRVATLADYLTEDLPAPRLLKIDVQGLELDVLRGAGEALVLADEVFVECSFVELYEGQALADEVICHLRQVGHRLVGVHGVSASADGSTLQADLLFRRT